MDEQIFPHVALGFGDTIPAMREQTVKVNAICSPLKDSFLAWKVTFDLPKEVGNTKDYLTPHTNFLGISKATLLAGYLVGELELLNDVPEFFCLPLL